MNCKEDIEELAKIKLMEANILLENGFHDGAYYLGGYTIELLLKAKVCKTLGISDFFLFKHGKPETFKAYKAHDYEQLLLLSGIFMNFQEELKTLEFKQHWSIINKWSEQSRYLTGKTKNEVEDFLFSITEVSKWIQKHL